jgi:hypothetical protein
MSNQSWWFLNLGVLRGACDAETLWSGGISHGSLRLFLDNGWLSNPGEGSHGEHDTRPGVVF